VIIYSELPSAFGLHHFANPANVDENYQATSEYSDASLKGGAQALDKQQNRLD
jgi:hypothetical protein